MEPERNTVAKRAMGSCVSRGGHSTQVVGRGGGEVGKLHNRGASVVLVGAESAIGTNRRRKTGAEPPSARPQTWSGTNNQMMMERPPLSP